MTRREFIKLVGAAGAFAAYPNAASAAAPAGRKRPNVIFILADDLGYGDIGCLFQNLRQSGAKRIATPNIDRLAAEGATLTDHYTCAPVCAPARASLMTGRNQGSCSLRDNMFDFPISEKDTLGTVMRSAGYETYAIGKWGIGGGGESGQPMTAHPLDKGFDHFYGFLAHLAGHTYYHYEGSVRSAYMGIHEDREVATKSAEGIYSTDLFAARAKKEIADKVRRGGNFFMYLAFNTIHGSGLGNPTLDCKEHLHVPGRPYPEGGGVSGGVRWPLEPEARERRNTWLEPECRAWRKEMARYATAVRRLDRAVGDIMATLKDLGIDRDTMVVFSSDNGPANEYGADTRFFTSAGPFDGLKRDCFEGGMREPTFVRWPGAIKAGLVSSMPSSFADWMPTLAEVADAKGGYVTDGVSLAPLLGVAEDGRRQETPTVYCEYAGQPGGGGDFKEFAARKGGVAAVRGQQQMVRRGDFVALRTAIKTKDDPLRLYNVVRDPYQTHNLASDPMYAGVLADLRRLMNSCHHPNPRTPRPYD